MKGPGNMPTYENIYKEKTRKTKKGREQKKGGEHNENDSLRLLASLHRLLHLLRDIEVRRDCDVLLISCMLVPALHTTEHLGTARVPA